MYVTLSISAVSIRLLSVKGRQVKKWGEAPLAPELVRDGLILQPEAVGETIAALLKSTRVAKERVITCLSGLSFTYRTLSLPRINPALLEEAIERAARQEMPLPLEELYLSWQAIGGGGEEQDFFILGVSRNLVDAMVRTLAVAGIEPYLMDLKPLVLARAANRADAIIVSLEPDCFDIVLVANGIPAIMHTVSPRGEGATPEDNVRRLTDELLKTVNFYDNSHPESTLSLATPLLLTGELSSNATASSLIQAAVEYPVEPLVPSMKFPPELPLALYAANMGLALKKVPQKTVAKGDTARFHDLNLNILSGKYRKARAQAVPVRYVLILAVIVIACGLLFPLYQVRSQAKAEVARLQDELRVVNRELNLRNLTIDEANKVEAVISELTAEAETLQQEQQQLLSRGGDFARNLTLVTGALPAESYFTSIEMDYNRTNVSGEADNVYRVISYAVALEELERFSEVRIIEIDEAPIAETEGTEHETEEAETGVITFAVVMDE